MSEGQGTWRVESHGAYLAEPHLSSSLLKELATKTPAHYLHRLTNPKEQTPAMAFGSKVHAGVLEDAPFIIAPDVDRRSKAGKAAWDAAEAEAEASGVWMVTEEEDRKIHAMRDSVWSIAAAREAITQGVIERSGYSVLRGHEVKIRPDVLHDGIIWDLKTTMNASPESFAREVVNYGYHVQAAFYMSVANIIEPGSVVGFRWIAVEKDAPHCAAVYTATPEFIQLGAVAVIKGLTLLSECLRTDEWPGYLNEPQDLLPPAWILKGMDDL